MKHIVIIIDGTWVSAADASTPFSNAYNLNWMLDTQATDGYEQIVLYSSGIGTDKAAGTYLSGATARGIDHQTREAYINVCSNFKIADKQGKRDKLYIFGFSRGGVVARALTSLITDFGVLKPSQMHLFPGLWRRFIGGKKPSEKVLSNVLYKDVEIEMVGLFDCVFGMRDRTGQFHTLKFRDYQVPAGVKAAVHLLSLDDRRVAFAPMLWDHGNGNSVLEQIWMPGVHSDIGGTYMDNRLGKIALLTMMDRLHKYTNLQFHPESVKNATASSGRITVNNDIDGFWKLNWLRPFQRIYRPENSQFLHPIVKTLLDDEIEINYKGKSRVYSVHKSFTETQGVCPYFQDFELSPCDWARHAGLQ